ncbi:MAG: MFS transporter [Planctomycetes bacterium]|jgi:AAA family ATP:ADP antiporter|nr:MFS transporter [Planctomycetota bacterium]
MKLLDIENHEIKPTLLGISLFFFRDTGKAIGWSAVQAILLKRWGLEGFTWSFVIFALLAMVGSFIYLFFADTIKKEKLIKIYCSYTGILMIFSSVFLENATNDDNLLVFSILMALSYGIGTSSLGAQSWTIINEAFTPKQGIRIYPIITLAPVLGGIIGGFLLQFLPELIGTRGLICLWGLSILSVIPIVNIFEENYKIKKQLEIEEKTKPFNLFKNFKDGCQYALKNRLVWCLAGICILFWFVASLKHYQYGNIINQTFQNEVTLQKYFGYYNICMNTMVLFFQVFITGNIIKSLGVGKSLCVLPCTIAIGLLCMGIFPVFWIAFFMLFFWDLIAMTIQGTAYQLSYHAIEHNYRGRIRGILDGFFNPIGGVLGGSFLLIFNNYFVHTIPESIQNISVTFLGLIFALFWIFLAFQTKRRYYKSILDNLHSKDNRTYLDALEMVAEIKGTHFVHSRQKELENFELSNSSIPAIPGDIQNETMSIETTDTEIIWKRNVLQGHLTLYCTKYSGCKKMQFELHDNIWQAKYKSNHLMIRKQYKNFERLITVSPDMIYWKDETGYLAIFWKNKYISHVEIGNFIKDKIDVIKCKSNAFLGPYQLKEHGKTVSPQSRLLLNISILGQKL